MLQVYTVPAVAVGRSVLAEPLVLYRLGGSAGTLRPTIGCRKLDKILVKQQSVRTSAPINNLLGAGVLACLRQRAQD